MITLSSEERARRSTIIPEASTSSLGDVAAALRRSDDEDDLDSSGDFEEPGGNSLYGSGQTELPTDDTEIRTETRGEEKTRKELRDNLAFTVHNMGGIPLQIGRFEKF